MYSNAIYLKVQRVEVKINIGIILTIVILFTAGCSKHDEWLLILYSSKSKTFEYKAGVYMDVNECRVEGKSKLIDRGLEKTGTFECALNCEYPIGRQPSLLR